ncbi:AraC family transcriptional regulator [Terrarubrum flagellatum]|uniref:AraC family transcriptional regulator n=1 Tax=Terrirubrum flagellatum TaxID=2895980 RepID=UPI003145281A
MLNDRAPRRMFIEDAPPPASTPQAGDWIRLAPAQPGIERIDAFFSGHAYDPHRHDAYALGTTLSGVQRFDYRGREANSRSGDAIVLHPDERHNGRSGAEGGFRYRMLYLEPRLIRDALGEKASALPFANSPVLRDAPLSAALTLALRDMERRLETLELDQAVLAIADALLAIDASAQTSSVRSIACGRAVDRARQFLDANATRVVASEELEDICGLDRYALARQFRARLGVSPYRYLTMRRLDRAKAMMRTGDALAEIAFACGFADQSHMTRQFKQAFGLSPGKWRAIQAGNA